MQSTVTVTVTRRAALLAVGALVAASALVSGGVAWAAQTFSDVPSSHPFATEIEWAAANGIVNGYSDGTFRPGNVVTRQAAVAFLSRLNDEVELVYGGVGAVPHPGTARSVHCPAGKRALAGGSASSTTDLYLQDSYPVTAGNTAATTPVEATGWRVYWRVAPGVTLPGGQTGQVWVLCAPAPAAG